jgi:ubiquinol-cytochrome c reductase iron-sulfur subunit
MANSASVDLGRRRFLTTTAAVVGGAGVAATAIPFILSLEPSERTLAQGAPVEIDISKLPEGHIMTVMWRSKPVWVLHRSKQQLATLAKMNPHLKDPDSKQNQQPTELTQHKEWKKHPLARALNPRYLVVVGICTHLQCIPDFKPDPGSVSASWLGGFFCPCHGSRYDLSGRVLDGSPAPLNLPVPPYYYKSDTLVRVGEFRDGSGSSWSPGTW